MAKRSFTDPDHHAWVVQELVKRDGWACQICGQLLKKGKSTATHKAATIDHITPLCIGGTDAMTNLRLLCAKCNSSRPDATRPNSTLDKNPNPPHPPGEQTSPLAP